MLPCSPESLPSQVKEKNPKSNRLSQSLIVLGIVKIQKHVRKANQPEPERTNVILQPTGYNERIVGVSLLPFQPMQKLILQMETNRAWHAL